MSIATTSRTETPTTNHDGQTFGAWLVAQNNRGGLLGQLAAGAAADRRFPRAGDPGQVRQHLSTMQADGDMFAALDDAETDWMAY